MASRSIFVTWPMEAEARAILGRVGTVRTSRTEHELPVAELAQRVADCERGPVVDEAALVDALQTKRIAGAGLDIFEEEPKLHSGLLGLENLALTPHIGSASGATRLMMATRAAENCVAALEGHRPPNLVNPEAWRSP